jgi:hypothetical protein
MLIYRCAAALVVLLAGALAACAPASVPIEPEMRAPAFSLLGELGLPKDWDAYDDARRAEHESRVLAGAPARRAGPLLILRLANGQERPYRDGPCDDERNPGHCSKVFLAAFLARQGAFLVTISTAEGLAYRLVDLATGSEVELADLPAFSPSGKVFVTNRDDGMVLVVWRRDGRSWTSETTLQLRSGQEKLEYAWTLIGWRTDNAFELEGLLGPREAPVRRLRRTVSHATNGWVLTAR